MRTADGAARRPACGGRLRSKAVAVVAGALLAACAAPRFSAQTAAEMGYQVLGPQMRMQDGFVMAWIPGPPTDAAASPFTPELARLLAPAARGPLNVTVAGDDSAFAAAVLAAACGRIDTPLPGLRLVFIGNEADAALAQGAVRSRGAEFHFERAP